MATVLLILGKVRSATELIETAIDRAKKQNDELVIFSPLDPAADASKVIGKFMDSGTIGARPSDAFMNTLSQRQEELARRQTEEAVAEAERKGVAARAEVRRGDYEREASALIRSLTPKTVIVEKRKRPFLRFGRVEHAFLDGLGRDVGFDLVER